MTSSFWSSVDLTGNQTAGIEPDAAQGFWSSVDLTGNQTVVVVNELKKCFGAVSI